MRYFIDTNVVSELRRPKPHQRVLNWLSGLASDQLFLSAVTVGEIQAGIEITREQDSAKAEELEVWLNKVLEWKRKIIQSCRSASRRRKPTHPQYQQVLLGVPCRGNS